MVWIDTTSPATASADSISRSSAPSIRPMISSFSTAPPMSPSVPGICGRCGAATGARHSDSIRAKASRMRGGTKPSPMPGISITTAPTRRNTRPTA